MRKNSDERVKRVLTNSAEFGILDQRDYFEKDIADKGNLQNHYVVQKGDYVYNPRVSAAAPVGPISQNKIGTGVTSPLYTVFRFHASGNEFFAQFFDSGRSHGFLRANSRTGARHDLMSIGADVFMQMPVPDIASGEQQKIADCLSSLTAYIDAETRKLDALKVQKQGLMQHLFPVEGQCLPRLRVPGFKGAWGEVKLSAQVELISGQHLVPDAYADEGDVPYFTGPSDYSNDLASVRKWTSRSANTGFSGDTLITVKGSGVGELLHLAFEEVAMGRQLMAARPRKTADGGFLFQFLGTQRDQFSTPASGNLIPGLSRGDILGLKIKTPPRAEQQKIADCLSSLDDLIAAQSRKIATLQQHKKGLMQGLFPALDAHAA